MTIEAVTLMRNIRDQMSLDIQGMTFEDEQAYLTKQIVSFRYLTETAPNKRLVSHATAGSLVKPIGCDNEAIADA
jgi:hypothetical protein